MINLVEDISSLTDVSENTLKKFIPIILQCLGHYVHEQQCKKSDSCVIDLGVGELHIKLDKEGIRYRFTPSKELEATLISTLKTKTSPMITKLEKNLQEKIERAYKELL